MEIFNPPEQELRKLGFGRFTYEDNWLACAKISGIHLFSHTFTVVYHSTRFLVLLSMFMFIYGAFREGDKENSLECVQYVLVIIMMYGGCAAFGYYHEDYISVMQMIGKRGFDYERTLNPALEGEINRYRARKTRHKKFFKTIFLGTLVSLIVGLCGKKPLGILLLGKKRLDGANNLVWNGAFGMYMPFANNWMPYILAIAFSNGATVWIVIGCVGYVSTFLFIAEELLCEFAIVGCTLNRCVERANMLHTFRMNDGVGSRKLQIDDEETKTDCLKHCLHLCVKHHLRTLKAFDSFKNIMYLPLLAMLVGWALVTCLSVYLLLSDAVSVDFKVPLPVMIFAEAIVAFIFCFYGEMLTTACEDVGRQLYENPECFDHSKMLKPYASIIRSYCESPNALSAGGFCNMNHVTFKNMISTAYSYIGFLISTY